DDCYLFGRGSGHDTVVDYDLTAGNVDTITLAADVLPSDVTLEIAETDLRIVIAGTEDTLLVTGWFADDASKVERIVFTDGTVWDTQYIRDNARAENVILGTPNNDALVGTDREDTLIGLQGNDSLTGGLGNDTYVLSKGAGTDRIIENDSTTGNLDVIRFTDVTSTELDDMERWGNDLVLNYGDDRVTVVNYFGSSAAHVEAIVFSDGIVLDEAAMNRARVVSVTTGTDSGNVIYGDASTDNRIYALGGKDSIAGRGAPLPRRPVPAVRAAVTSRRRTTGRMPVPLKRMPSGVYGIAA
ncbi:MAG: calcium-binding protein, partial [Pseudomonadota bacterium]